MNDKLFIESLVNEMAYLDNVPDMSGQPTRYDKDGMPMKFVPVKHFDKFKGIKSAQVRHNPWETGQSHIKSGYNYWKCAFTDGSDEFYVKAPTTFDRDRLVDKIDKFVIEEYGEMIPWEFVCQVSSREARANSLWSPPWEA